MPRNIFMNHEEEPEHEDLSQEVPGFEEEKVDLGRIDLPVQLYAAGALDDLSGFTTTEAAIAENIRKKEERE